MNGDATPDRRVSAAENAFEVIKHLSERGDATLGELADELDFTKGTVYTCLATIRERGFAVNRGENLDGWRAVASPVVRDGTVLGAIAASGPDHRMSDDRLTGTLSEIVTAAANEVQLRLLSE